MPTLRQQRVSPAYQRSLSLAYQALCTWCFHRRFLPRSLSNKPEQFSDLLADYIEFLYSHGKKVSKAKLALLAVQHKFRHLRNNLQRAWDALSTWQNLVPLRMRTPAPEYLTWSLFAAAMLHATLLEPHLASQWFGFGIGLFTMFHGMLRPGEWFKLHRRDILLPLPHQHSTDDFRVLLSLFRPKNQKQMGKSQIAIVDDKVCIRWLAWLCEGLDLDAFVSTISIGQFRVMLRRLLEYLGLDRDLLTPSSFRAGAATTAFKRGVDLHRLRLRGRWKTLTSLDHYIQEAASCLVSLQISPSIISSLERLLSRTRFLRKPPLRPWQSSFARGSLPRHGRFSRSSARTRGR